MSFPFRTHAVPLRVEIVSFPLVLNSSAGSGLHMPCCARAMPRPCRSESDISRPRTVQRRMGAAWHVWISISRPEKACGRSARIRLLPATTRSYTKVVNRKHTNSLNCSISSSAISGYHADFHEGHGTVGEWQVHGMVWQGNGMGAAWNVWIWLYYSVSNWLTIKFHNSSTHSTVKF
jgi:hypothetical protein